MEWCVMILPEAHRVLQVLCNTTMVRSGRILRIFSNGFTADYLVVAGGGAGGGSNPSNATTIAGGGGAGGYKQISSYSILKNTPYTVTIGSGGSGNNAAAGDDGLSSVFSNITATGGVGGGSSGGNSGDSPQNTGGTNYVSTVYFGAGGGAGAGQNGNNGTSSVGGNGGNGIQSSITGTSTYYGGGGGGAIYQNTPGSGGLGGGGNGYGEIKNGDSGIINTGGGGGGGGYLGGQPATETRGGNGGSGTVILRYPTADVSSYAVTGTLDTVADTAYPIANLAYYKLNGDALDSSGNGYNGTFTTPAYAAGRFGQAAVFNGSSSYINLGSGASGLSGLLNQKVSQSVSFWMNTSFTGLSGNSVIYSVYYGNGVSLNIYYFADGTLYFFTRYSGNATIFQTTQTFNDSQWHHIAVSIDVPNLERKVYINNTLESTQTLSSSAYGGSGLDIGVALGTAGNFNTQYYKGNLDQVRIFSSAISAGNVTSLYNEGTVNESTDGTDSILQFIGGTGTVTFS